MFNFSSLKHDLLFNVCMHPLAVLSHLRPRFPWTTSSVITGMRGAKAGVSPPRRSPACIPLFLHPILGPDYYVLYLVPSVILVMHRCQDRACPVIWWLCRSPPRWSGGCPRLVLALLVLEFESHRGEVLNLFEKYEGK